MVPPHDDPADRLDRLTHEAGNALAVVRGRLQLMRRRIAAADVDRVRDLDELATIEAEVDRALALVVALQARLFATDDPGHPDAGDA